MSKKLLSKLASKALKEVKENIQKLLDGRKTSFNVYDEVDTEKLSIATLKEATKTKAEIDALVSKVTILQAKYKPLREEILASLPGTKNDKVEVTIENIHLKKYPQIKGAGKLEEDKFLELAKKKKILQKVTKHIRVIDQDSVMAALAEGLITYDEYIECVSEGKPTEHLSLEKLCSVDVEQEHSKVV